MHLCTVHNERWMTTPARALNGCGCGECKLERFRASMYKTNEQFLSELAAVTDDFVPLEPYKGAREKMMFYCKKHGVAWETVPSNIINGHGCKKCMSEKITEKNSMTFEEYTDKLNEICPTIKCIGGYTNATSPALHKCLVDEYEWETCPSYIISGSRCPKCRNRLHKSHEEFVVAIHDINPEIELIGEFVNMKTPIKAKCLKDGNVWDAHPGSLINGGGCPLCHESIGERAVRIWLEEHNIEYISQHSFSDCKNIQVLFFDFYLPKLSTVIEYDGRQHYRPVKFYGGEVAFEKCQKRDAIKKSILRKEWDPNDTDSVF